MKKILIALIIFWGISATCQQLGIEKIQKLDSLFNELEAGKMSMGSINILIDGKQAYSRIYGISNNKDGKVIPADESKTVYRIGSLSKIFTAYLTMKLVEDGKLSLTQNVENFFPNLKQAGFITVEDLLSHKSLLPIFHKTDDLDKLRETKDEKSLIAAINKRGPNSDTTKVTYNNLNYILLGLIVEKVNERPYNEVLADNLAKIPGIKAYGIYNYLDSQKNQANSFHIENRQWEEDYEIEEWPLTDGSGFLLSDAKSVNEFMYALFNQQLLTKEMLDKMLPDKNVFGYGLMKTNFDAHKGIGHTGRIEGFTSATSYFPNDKINITFLQNGTVYPMNDIMLLVVSIIFGQPAKIPNFKEYNLSADELTQLLGTYANDEEGYKVIVDLDDKKLRLRIAKGNSLLNKTIVPVYALGKSRLFNPQQGIIFDFSKSENGSYSACEMKVNGSKLPLAKIAEKK